jgi:hypothetical protein
MCLAMNPDKLAPEERCASTSNRNFEGRQGFKGRTHLVRRRWRRQRRSPGISSISGSGGEALSRKGEDLHWTNDSLYWFP